MNKELSEMTLEELWELFPIFLVEHDDGWSRDFKEMETFLKSVLNDFKVDRISHIGSTAVNKIWAKNIVDILLEIPSGTPMIELSKALESQGFIVMSKDNDRISLNKGYTKDGFAQKVYHIHLRYTGDNDELYFRDYLREHPDIASAYEDLKLSLWKKFEHDRDGYTEAKTRFIRKYTELAKEEYKGRY